ncbi:50S ribosomal protein L15 [Candidatus Peregrinibacteria bacterium]|nr:50S ribosomal protein L15 [Candidatus Peregrinibacteria bacterium]
MLLNSIQSKSGATKKKKRIGRGNASGHGTFSGRGCKGQGQRKSGNVRPGFEGGQTPLIMRLPKLRGFKNPTKAYFQVVNVKDLDRFKDGDEVNVLTLLEKRLVRQKGEPVKLLGHGKLTKKLTVKLHKISATAKDKVLQAGGKII